MNKLLKKLSKRFTAVRKQIKTQSSQALRASKKLALGLQKELDKRLR